MLALELVAVAFSVACVVLAARRHIGTWPAGIVAVVAYFIIFVDTRLYADAALQIIFLGQGIYGWALWFQRHPPVEEPTIERRRSASGERITVLSWPRRMLLAAIVIVSSAAVGTLLARYTDASRPFIDATVSVLSLAANWLLARRVLENWALWLTADVLYVALFISKNLLPSALLYTVFLALAIGGWREWLRTMTAGRRPRVEWAT